MLKTERNTTNGVLIVQVKVKMIGVDSWGREVFQNVDSGRIYKLIRHSLTNEYPNPWYFTASGFEGEPDCPLRKDIIIKTV